MKRGLVVLGLVVVFGGVQAQTWSQEAVDALVREGLVYGYPDGSVKPEAYIRRGEVFTLLWRLILSYRLRDLQALTGEDIANLKALISKAEELGRALQDQGQVLQAYADALRDLRERLEKTQAESSTLSGAAREKAEEALAQVGSFVERLTQVEASLYRGLRDFREEVSALAGALRDVDAKAKALEEALERRGQELQRAYGELQGVLSQVAGRVASMEALLARVKDAEDRLKTLEGRLSSLEGQVKGLREEVARLKAEMPKVEVPPPLGFGVYLAGVSPLSGFLRLGYGLPQGLGVYARLTYDPLGFYASLGLVHVLPSSPFSVKTFLGVGRGFYGPGFVYGEVGNGFGVRLVGELGLSVEGTVSFPVGVGPSVARFGVGVMYGW